MDRITDNAVNYYRHLRAQDVAPGHAVLHVKQRFGIPAEVIMDRVNGRVADPEATREALAEAREYLSMGYAESEAFRILSALYEAITGETL
jgi:hypothetical protein